MRIDAAGLAGPTPAQARASHWRQTSRGLYVPAYVEQSAPQRIVQAAAVLPTVGGVTGWATLNWLGGTWFDGLDLRGLTPLPVDLATCYEDIRSQDGYVVHQERLGPGELIVHDGVSTTTAVRALCFMMRYAADVRVAVQCADMAAFSDLVSIAEIAAYLAAHPGWTGIPQARAALLSMNENSWSKLETWMRMLWEIDAGFPRPLCNRPIFDLNGRHIATPDLLDVEAGVWGEYDGAMHLEGKRRARDEARANALRNAGLEGFTVMAADLPDPASAVQRMVDARRRAKWQPECQRQWTIEPPPWWTPTHTVELRRRLSAGQRARLLRRGAS